jgi:hypothetical protein
MPDQKKLRAEYDRTLAGIWETWDSWISAAGLSPFMDMEEVPELEEQGAFNYEVGWVQGVANAMDWPTDRPLGPKEWSPSGKYPRRKT